MATLGSNQMTITTGDKFIPEVWSQFVRQATESRLVMANLVKRFDSEVAGKGDKIHIPDISNLTASNKSANTEVTLQSPTESEVTIDINKHKETSFLIEDNLEWKSMYDLQKYYTEKAGYAIAKAVDTDLLGLYSGLSQTVGDENTAVSDANILRAIQYLDDADAPNTERYFVIRPVAKKNLLSEGKFVLNTGPGWTPENSPIVSGKFGEIYGVQVYVSSNVIIDTATTPDTVHNILFQKEAFALAMQQAPRTQMDYILQHLGTLVVTDVAYGLGELRDTFAVDFKSSI